MNVFGENLSNSNASTFTSTDQFIVAQTPLRPRCWACSSATNFEGLRGGRLPDHSVLP